MKSKIPDSQTLSINNPSLKTFLNPTKSPFQRLHHPQTQNYRHPHGGTPSQRRHPLRQEISFINIEVSSTAAGSTTMKFAAKEAGSARIRHDPLSIRHRALSFAHLRCVQPATKLFFRRTSTHASLLLLLVSIKLPIGRKKKGLC